MRKLVPYAMPDGSRPASRLPVILSAVLAVAVVALLALNVYQYNTVSDLESQLYTQGQELATAKSDLNDAEYDIESMKAVMLNEADSIEYMAHYGAFSYTLMRVAPNDQTGLYHRINCSILNSSTDWLINGSILDAEAAESRGLTACPLCDDTSSLSFQELAKHSNSVFDFVDLIRNGDDRDWYIYGSLARNSLNSNNQ